MKIRMSLPFLALALLLCACGGGQDGAGSAPYTAADAQALLDAGAFSGQMEPVDSVTALLLYGIDEADVSGCVCYMASNTSVSADEVTVLEMKSEDAAVSALAACEERIASQIDSCTSYCPDQVPRLEDATILRRGSSVLLAVGDPDKLPQALRDLSLLDGAE